MDLSLDEPDLIIERHNFRHGWRLTIFALLWMVGAYAQGTATGGDVRRLYEAGESAMQHGDLAAAEKQFLGVLNLVPNDVGARVNLGVAYMRQQRWQEALQYLNAAQKLAPQVGGIRLNIGLVHYRQGDYLAAIPDFEAVLKGQDSSQARRLLGLCYLFEERYSAAADELEPLWPESSADVTYLYSLAVAAGNSSKHELEERAIRRLMEVGHDSPVLHLLLGKAYMAHEDYDNALVELLKASNADSKLPMLHYNLGVVYRHKGELDKSRSEFLEDVAIEPGVAFNYDELGMLSSLDGKAGEAESYFSDAVKRDSTIGTAWFGLAKVYRQQKRYGDSLKALSRASAIDPNSASVHYLRGQVLSALNRKTDAEAEFATVQRLKKETVDKLERQVSGAKYLDPELRNQ